MQFAVGERSLGATGPSFREKASAMFAKARRSLRKPAPEHVLTVSYNYGGKPLAPAAVMRQGADLIVHHDTHGKIKIHGAGLYRYENDIRNAVGTALSRRGILTTLI